MSNIMNSRGRGKKKRKWTSSEVDVTLDFVLGLKGDARWRCEGGFRNGFYQHLAEKLENFFPGVGLTAAQIDSKLKFLKEKYTAIHEMTKLSGFTWDEETSMINCERQDNREEYVSQQKKMLMSEIAMLDGVSELDAIEASRVISRTPSELENFYSCPNDHWKKLYVQSIICRLRASSGGSGATGL